MKKFVSILADLRKSHEKDKTIPAFLEYVRGETGFSVVPPEVGEDLADEKFEWGIFANGWIVFDDATQTVTEVMSLIPYVSIDLVTAFESATRAHENIGSQPIEDHAIIEEEFKSAKENLIGEVTERTNDPALAVIRYITSDEVDGSDDAMDFLNYWNEGEFDILRRNWDNIPDEVFIGAEVGFVPGSQSQGEDE